MATVALLRQKIGKERQLVLVPDARRRQGPLARHRQDALEFDQSGVGQDFNHCYDWDDGALDCGCSRGSLGHDRSFIACW